jgi:16S rRNA (adenine1518-N6/adenine1519-N6)-dimethyltransferase
MFDTDSEILEIVDEMDLVVGNATRKTIHDNDLIHRAVHIFLFNPNGEIFVQKRSARKDRHPLKVDSSAAGHVSPGEAYLEAANRELKEELSISEELREVLRVPPCPATGYEHVVLFQACTDEEPVLNLEEAIGGWFLTPDQLSYAMKTSPDDFVPAFILLWDKYQGRPDEGSDSASP